MSGFIDCVSNLLRPTSKTECLMFNILLVLLLELVQVEAAVLAVSKVSEVRDVGAISGCVQIDL